MYITGMEEIRNAYKCWSGNLKGRDHLEDLGMNEKIILEWILKNGVGRCEMDSRIWTRGGPL